MNARRAQLVYAAALSAALLLALAFARTLPFVSDLDHAAAEYISSLRSSGLVDGVATFTEIFSIPVMVIVLFGMFCALYFGREREPAWLLLASSVLGVVLFVLIKVIVHAPRPTLEFIPVSGWSFPSGHATIATIFFMFLSHLFERVSKSKLFHLLFNLIALFMILAVSFSRLYLGVHWLSDVIGGMLLGAFASSLARLAIEEDIFNVFRRRRKPAYN